MINTRPWHYHDTPIPDTFKVYRGETCEGRQNPHHSKVVGAVQRKGKRRWYAELFSHIANVPSVWGMGRTRNEAVCDALCKKGVPRAD